MTRSSMPAVVAVTLLILASLGTIQALNPADFKGKNVVLFITDQERHITHFPQGWSKNNLPGWERLKKNGMYFKNAFTCACMCTPARATLFSGYFPAQHGSHWTLEANMPADQYPQMPLVTPEQGLTNMATVMSAAGYDFVYKGKLHLTKPSSSEAGFRPIDAGKYGFTRWTTPDAGANQEASENGGPMAFNDQRFMNDKGLVQDGKEGIIKYLEQVAAKTKKPFFLVASLVNPHDVLMYPTQFNATYKNTTWLEGDMQLPVTVNENITYPYKPSAQQQILDIMKALGVLPTPQDKLNYINFYGNLMKYVDQSLVRMLDTLESIGKLNDTVIIRTADHGELGMTHGGLRQKSFVFYEEAIKVPLMFSNPVLFPNPISTEALVSHVDMVPTLASLFGAPASAKQKNWPGRDYSSVIFDPNATGKDPVQDYIVFTFADVQSGQNTPPYVLPPAHIIGIREIRYKLAKYYDVNAEITGIKPQFEMYDLKSDPNELRNIASSLYNRSANQAQEFKRLKSKLEYVETYRLKPLPLRRPVNIYARTRNVSKNGTVFLDESVTGGMSGPPIGKLASCNLTYVLNPAKSTAKTQILIQSVSGIIRGVAALTYSTSGNNITFTGKANFTSGTGAFRGIKATGLKYIDTNTLSGQQGRVNITGVAYY